MLDSRKCRLIPLEVPEDWTICMAAFGTGAKSDISVVMAYSPGKKQYIVANFNGKDGDISAIRSFAVDICFFSGFADVGLYRASMDFSLRSQQLLRDYEGTAPA